MISSDYDPDLVCGICSGYNPNEEHEVHTTPCVSSLLREKYKSKALVARWRKLLRRGLKPLNSTEYQIWVEDVEKELE